MPNSVANHVLVEFTGPTSIWATKTPNAHTHTHTHTVKVTLYELWGNDIPYIFLLNSNTMGLISNSDYWGEMMTFGFNLSAQFTNCSLIIMAGLRFLLRGKKVPLGPFEPPLKNQFVVEYPKALTITIILN